MPPEISAHDLSERELAIATVAADLAVKQMTENFYTEVGRTVVKRFFIVVGAAAVAFAFGKGWISINAFLGK